MPTLIQKFKKEIKLLNLLNQEPALHPLRQEQIRQNILQKIVPAAREDALPLTRRVKKEKLWRYIISILTGLSLVGGTAFASNRSTPGDTLFPLKKVKEKLEVSLATNDTAKAEIEIKHAQGRLDDLSQVRSRHGSADNQKAAENEALDQVNNALRVLTDVKTKLEIQGDTQAASALATNIQKLKSQAKQHNLSFDGEDNKAVRDGDPSKNQDEQKNKNTEENPVKNNNSQNKGKYNAGETRNQDRKNNDSGSSSPTSNVSAIDTAKQPGFPQDANGSQANQAASSSQPSSDLPVSNKDDDSGNTGSHGPSTGKGPQQDNKFD